MVRGSVPGAERGGQAMHAGCRFTAGSTMTMLHGVTTEAARATPPELRCSLGPEEGKDSWTTRMWAETFRETKQQVEVWCPWGQVHEKNGAADLKKKKNRLWASQSI